MKEIAVGSRQKINLETWERRAAFQFFKDFTEPYHGVCLRVDCTTTYRYAKQHHLSVFLSLLHRSLVAAHRVENFRTRIVDGDVWLYEQIHGGSAVGRANGTIGLGHYQFRARIHEFVQEAAIELDRVRQRDDIELYPEANLIRFSVLPWFDFTSISHARDFSRADSAPASPSGKLLRGTAGAPCRYRFTHTTLSPTACMWHSWWRSFRIAWKPRTPTRCSDAMTESSFWATVSGSGTLSRGLDYSARKDVPVTIECVS
jgi:chloramphenicol O-acetyltransferase type A